MFSSHREEKGERWRKCQRFQNNGRRVTVSKEVQRSATLHLDPSLHRKEKAGLETINSLLFAIRLEQGRKIVYYTIPKRTILFKNSNYVDLFSKLEFCKFVDFFFFSFFLVRLDDFFRLENMQIRVLWQLVHTYDKGYSLCYPRPFLLLHTLP
jgi:hypothetical protein